MQLVTFQEPIHSTLQGEGSLVGTLSTFVRLWGCNDHCDWCDTPESWRPGSKYQDVPVFVILDKIHELRNQHVVITGGNPLLQGQELLDVIPALRALGHHITLETQGSIFHRVAGHANLLSLSPKLHAWNDTVLDRFLASGGHYAQAAQFKVVVQSKSDVDAALVRLDTLRRKATRSGFDQVSCFIQPEWGRGRGWAKEIMEHLQTRQECVGQYGWVRVLSQIHKSHLRVI